jgi:hypothetical protein
VSRNGLNFPKLSEFSEEFKQLEMYQIMFKNKGKVLFKFKRLYDTFTKELSVLFKTKHKSYTGVTSAARAGIGHWLRAFWTSSGIQRGCALVPCRWLWRLGFYSARCMWSTQKQAPQMGTCETLKISLFATIKAGNTYSEERSLLCHGMGWIHNNNHQRAHTHPIYIFKCKKFAPYSRNPAPGV